MVEFWMFFLTNVAEFYEIPKIIPAVLPDNPDKASPSDHSTVLATPISSFMSNSMVNTYFTKLVRPQPQSKVDDFGKWIVQYNWPDFEIEATPNDLVAKFEEIMKHNLDKFLPEKSIKLSLKDKPYINSEIKTLDRKVKREYRKHGKSEKYIQLKSVYNSKLKKATSNFLTKNVANLRESKPGKAFAVLKKMGAEPGDQLEDGSFTLIEHLESKLKDKESADKIANHFASISQEYSPLDMTKLPKHVKERLDITSESYGRRPNLLEHEVYQKLCKSKKSSARIPGDLPRNLAKEFAPELAKPLTEIFNRIIESGLWPDQWKIEYGIPLQKVKNPVNEDDLRIISLTSFYSKILEKFVIEWILEHIGQKIDMYQFGGQKGNGVAHYLIEFVNFILYNQDLRNSHPSIAVFVDFSKAFNRQDHNTLITLLCDLGIPGWLLSIIIGFLKDRNLILSYKNETSEKLALPGGGPQGTILGMFLFLILINEAGFKNIARDIGILATSSYRKRKPKKELHAKFVDDLTVIESINPKNCLIENSNPIRPMQYRERTGHVLDVDSLNLQQTLNDLKDYADEHGMRINISKTKAMVFNGSKTQDFLPKLQLDQNCDLQVVEEHKLLGVIFMSNMSWQAHVDHMCLNAYRRMWMLRRLKNLGAKTADLIAVYTTQIRCVVEFAVAVWNSGITKTQVAQLERIQRCALAIILADQFKDYKTALKSTNLEPLDLRRKTLCYKFALKSSKHPKFASWFCLSDEKKINTRTKRERFKPVLARTKRYEKSPIAYLTKLLEMKAEV